MKSWSFLLLLITLAVATPQSMAAKKPADEVENATVSAVLWLERIDRGDYAESWKHAAEYFRGAISEADWIQQLEAVRAPLGDLKARELREGSPHDSLPGAPDGHYIVLIFDTKFERKASATETVTMLHGADGIWRATGYFIK